MDQNSWTLNGGGWLVLALVNAGLSDHKYLSRLTWFLVSLLIGPIATFLIVVWQRAPVDPIETLHPFSNRADRWLALGAFGVLLALVLAFLAVIGASWYLGASAIVVFGLGLWAVFLYARTAAAARRG